MTFNTGNRAAARLRRARTPDTLAGLSPRERRAEVEKMMKEFMERGGVIQKIKPGVSGHRPVQRTPRWRQIRF